MPKLSDLEARATKAQQALTKAQAEAQAEQQRIIDERNARTIAAWQAVLDDWDPKALHQAKADAERQLVQAAEDSGLMGALVDYLAACLRESELSAFAERAHASGAVPREELRRHVGPNGLVGGSQPPTATRNKPVGDTDKWAPAEIGQVIQQAAQRRITAELDEYEQRIQAHIDGEDPVPAKPDPHERSKQQARERADSYAESYQQGWVSPEESRRRGWT